MNDSIDASYDYLFKILCIGETNVGKTTFIHQYVHDRFTDFASTIGIDIFEKYVTINNNERILLQIWDTAGQERFRSLTTSFFRNSMGFLLLFDVTNESSFLTIRNWMSYIENHSLADNCSRPPVLLVGNKIDLVTQREVDTFRAQQLANEFGMTYIETSSATGTHVQESLRIIIRKIVEFMNLSMEKYYPKQVHEVLTNDNNSKQKSSIKLLHKLSDIKKATCSCK